jgi:hypothetical protein
LRIYDIRKGKRLDVTLGVAINSFDLGVDPNFAACSCLDSVVRLIDISDGTLVAEYKGGHKTTQYHGAVRFNNDSKIII